MRCSKHPAGWVIGFIGSMRDSNATCSNWRPRSFRLMRLTAFTLLAVCTFASSTDIFLWLPVRVIVASSLYTQVTMVWRLFIITIMSPVTWFVDTLQLQCLQRVLGADAFNPGECHWFKISHNCVKTGLSFHFHKSKYP